MRSVFVKRNPHGVLKRGGGTDKQEKSSGDCKQTHSLACHKTYPRSGGEEKRSEKSDREKKKEKKFSKIL